MKKLIAALAIMAASLTWTAGSVLAADITIENPWARASAKMAKAGAAFLVIKNAGPADRLVSASSGVAKKTELHTHIKDGDIMRMRRVKDGIPVPAHGMQMLRPGSYHVMFMGLKAPFKEGSSFPITLHFEKTGKIDISVTVKKAGSMGGMKHDMKKMKH